MLLNHWLAFLAANLAVSLSPGPGALAVVNASLGGGLALGRKVVVGLQLALLVHLAVVAVGVGALVVASPLAFDLLRWCGAAYLAWLGVRQLLAARHPADPAMASQPLKRHVLLHGLLVNLSNPKSIVFAVALIPQFIDGTRPLLPQYALIGATMVTVDCLVMLGYAALAARLRPWFDDAFWVRVRLTVFGILFVALGAGLLLGTLR